MPARWSRPPPTDETGRLTPEARDLARRKVRRSLLWLVAVIVATGLLAYGCNQLRTSKSCCSPGPAAKTSTPAPGNGCRACPQPAHSSQH